MASCGYERNSDCLVTAELTGEALEIEIVSKVEKIFGQQMKLAVIEAAQEMGISGAKIVVLDFGALDFVIKARAKTALRLAVSEEKINE